MVKGGVPEPIDLAQERGLVLDILEAIRDTGNAKGQLTPILRRFPRPDGSFYAKSQLLGAYRALVEERAISKNNIVERRLRGRPVRTISGVAPVAVLTKPYPCPGTCLFCPDQQQAPKSYLDGEPGVLRAIQNDYDPYDQTDVRIKTLDALGHVTDKIELLILGGTWSYYPKEYQAYFLKRCFDAMNETPSATLEEAQARNETAPHRNVGLVIETRPDWITPESVVRLRQQGVTKVQLGAQSFDDHVLALNKRGHTVADTKRAMRLLRLGGVKIVLHWMPNLYGATLDSDLADFARMWDDPALRPDELKIYPTALLEGTELYDYWRAGDYVPYAEEDLIQLLKQCKTLIQPYCRVNRLMRDIPASYIMAGTKKSNLRQIIQQRMKAEGLVCQCIRCREIRGRGTVHDITTVHRDVVSYETAETQEHFIQYLTDTCRLAGFLRLSLPRASREALPVDEIREAAMIRELHVYGPAQSLGEQGGGGQHRGLGTQLLEEAAQISAAAGFKDLAVISAIGTREYYRERGFTRGKLYLIREL